MVPISFFFVQIHPKVLLAIEDRQSYIFSWRQSHIFLYFLIIKYLKFGNFVFYCPLIQVAEDMVNVKIDYSNRYFDHRYVYKKIFGFLKWAGFEAVGRQEENTWTCDHWIQASWAHPAQPILNYGVDFLAKYASTLCTRHNISSIGYECIKPTEHFSF